MKKETVLFDIDVLKKCLQIYDPKHLSWMLVRATYLRFYFDAKRAIEQLERDVHT